MIDVAIIGGALNGLMAALALAGPRARTPVPTVLIDRAEPESYGDPARARRASAITAASRRMLTALGVWEAVAPHAEAMRRIAVTDATLQAQDGRPPEDLGGAAQPEVGGTKVVPPLRHAVGLVHAEQRELHPGQRLLRGR